MPQNAELSSSRVIGEINLLERNEVGVWVEAGRKRRVPLRKRLDQRQEVVKQSSLNSKRKRGRVKMMQLICLVLQSPAHMVHPQKMCFQAKYQILLSIAHAFPCLSLPSYRNSSSSQEQIITSCFLFALILNTVTTFGLMLGLVKSSLKVKHTELLTSQTY